MSSAPNLPAELIEAELAALSRTPFQHLLAEWLTCEPTAADIRAFAKRNPGQWWQAVAIAARLAGYQDGATQITNVLVVQGLSDSDLLRRLAEAESALRQLSPTAANSAHLRASPQVIEGEGAKCQELSGVIEADDGDLQQARASPRK